MQRLRNRGGILDNTGALNNVGGNRSDSFARRFALLRLANINEEVRRAKNDRNVCDLFSCPHASEDYERSSCH